MIADPRLDFRAGMANLGAAVNVITSDGPGGRVGFTATAVCSLSDAPPSLLVCMNSGSSQNKAFRRNGVLCVNTLCEEHRHLSSVFAGMTAMVAEERFNQADWTRMETGAPVLTTALAAFDCVISDISDVGSHSIFICHVRQTLRRETGSGLVYFRRDYHTLPVESRQSVA